MKLTDLTLSQIDAEFEKNKSEFFKDYFDLLRFKSISTDPAFKNELLQCKEWLTHFLKKLDFEVELWETKNHPTIFAKSKQIPGKPTLLIYGHYDVQPVDPIEQWQSDPFEPTIRDNKVFARGAQDNKGQLAITLALLNYLHKKGEHLVNIKLCIEGEEEIGSTGLIQLVEQKKKSLQSDYLLVIDMGMISENEPAVTMSLRGLTSFEITLKGSKIDLHSGEHGGIAYNPLHALVQLLNSMRDEKTGKILIEGFYDDVIMPLPEEKNCLVLDFDEKTYEKMFGVTPLGGELSFSQRERNWMRPTLEINGIVGGYTGQGTKTVIPATAMAKITCRLVNNQSPKKINELIKQHIDKYLSKAVLATVSFLDQAPPARAPFHSKITKVVSQALTEVFTKPCKCIMSGGTVGVTGPLHKASNADMVIMGFGLPEDNIHAPNECFGMNRFKKGFITLVRILQLLG